MAGSSAAAAGGGGGAGEEAAGQQQPRPSSSSSSSTTRPSSARPVSREVRVAEVAVRPALRRQLSDEARKLLMGALTTPPHAFLCPITLEVMKEPVVCADGHTYERSAIEEWLRAGKRTSPVTGKRLPSVTTVTNFALRSSIEEFVAQRDAIETRNKSADDHDRARGGVLDQLRQRQQQQQGEKRWEQQV